MSDYFIPWDVFPEILIRLPAKDLFRFTSVSKEWNSLITNTNFIKTHLIQHFNHPSDLVLIRNCRVAQRIQKHNYWIEQLQEIYCLYRDEGNTLKKYCDIDFSIECALCSYYRIVGSCNGVICLSDDQDNLSTYTILLWNPVVKKRVKLPKFRVTYESHGPFTHIVGFGFDPKNCDYKVLRIVEIYDDSDDPFEVDIYSFGTGSWRNISHSALNLTCRMLGREPQTLFNGSVHWILFRFPGPSDIVVSFDLSDEVFNCIGLPTSNDVCGSLKLAVIGGSFCVVECYRERYCVWMMKEYGVESSWTKILNVDLPMAIDRVVGFRNNGKLLFESRKSLYSLTTFVPDTWLLTKLGINRDDEGICSQSFHTVSYTESLGLVGTGYVESFEEEEDSEEIE